MATTKRATPDTIPESNVTLEPFVTVPNGAKCRRCQRVRGERGQCKKPAMTGSKYCRNHGGALRPMIGPVNPKWKGGHRSDQVGISRRWQNDLPQNLRGDFLSAVNDPEILSLEAEIALIDTRLKHLVSQVGKNDDWDAVGGSYQRIVNAIRSNDSNELTAAMTELRDLAYANVDTNIAWSKVIKLTDRRRVLVESERKRMMEQHMFLTREEAHNYATALLEICTRNVRDRESLQNIFEEFRVFVAMQAQRTSAKLLDDGNR